MKVSTIQLLVAATSASNVANAFQVSTVGKSRTTQCSAASHLNGSVSNEDIEQCDGRRSLLQTVGASIAAAAAVSVAPPAYAGLLDDFGGDPSKIEDVAAERKKQEAAKAKASAKAVSDIEPNLRSNYYYPTNKVRYLPRIKKCNDAIPSAAAAIGNEDWENAEIFASKIADDTVLPMKLYVSSLVGGGTNVKVAFAETMKKDANSFEKAQQKLVKAVKKKDRESSSTALEELATALLSYRTAGRLLGPDGGGDIPSVDEIRRSACRVQGRSFTEKYVKARDERLASGGSS